MDMIKIIKVITSRVTYLFIGICLAISVSYVYAAIGTQTVGSGDILEATAWNTMKADLDNLDALSNRSLSCHTVTEPLFGYDSSISGSVFCDYGVRTGGGCRFNDSSGHRQVSDNYPLTNGWTCRSQGPTETDELYAYVICCEMN